MRGQIPRRRTLASGLERACGERQPRRPLVVLSERVLALAATLAFVGGADARFGHLRAMSLRSSGGQLVAGSVTASELALERLLDFRGACFWVRRIIGSGSCVVGRDVWRWRASPGSRESAL
jgi:hypothetical protein